MYITSQILVFIGLVIDLTGRCLKRKKNFLFFNVTAPLFYVSSYIFLNSWLGAMANGLNLIKNCFYIYFDKNSKNYKYYILTMVVIIAVFSVSLFIFWKSVLDLFLLASLIILCVGFAFKKILIARITLILNSLIWLVYNFSLKGYVNMICNLSGIVISLSAIIIYDCVPYFKRKQKYKYEIIG